MRRGEILFELMRMGNLLLLLLLILLLLPLHLLPLLPLLELEVTLLLHLVRSLVRF